MKKTITFFIALIWMISAIGNEWVSIHSNVPKAAEVQLITSDVSSSEVEFIVDGFFMNEVKTPKGIAYTIGVEEGTPLLDGRGTRCSKTYCIPIDS